MSMRSPNNERYTVDDKKPVGATRKGSSSAKPARAAASSVRVETNKARQTRRQKMVAESTMSKEERKAARAKEREKENSYYTAATILTDADDRYKKLKRVWWGLLIAAVVFTGLSWWLLSANIGGEVLSVVVLVLAYASIIGALVMDFTVVRKRRNYFRDKVSSMSQKQVDRIIENNYHERTALDAAKKARKAAKKAGLSAAAQQKAYDDAYAEGMKDVKRTAEEIVAFQTGKSAKDMKPSYSATVVADAAEQGADAVEAAKDAEMSRIADAKDAEEERLSAARKAAMDFAKSRRSGQ